MSDKKISELPAATTPAGTEEVPLVQGGITKKVTLSQILAGVPADQVTSVDGRTGAVTLDDRYVSVTGGSVTGSLAVSSFVAVGTNPAQSGAVRLANNSKVTWRNPAGTADHDGIYLGADGIMRVAAVTGTALNLFVTGAANSVVAIGAGSVTLTDAMNLIVGSTTGTKVGTSATQKLGFYGATPVVRPTGTPAAATDPATTMALVNSLRASLIALGLIS
jgi:hypothetical protein